MENCFSIFACLTTPSPDTSSSGILSRNRNQQERVIPPMRKRQITVLVYSLMVLLLAVAAAGQSRITSPKAQYGFNLGDDYQLANYVQLTEYWKKLAQQS